MRAGSRRAPVRGRETDEGNDPEGERGEEGEDDEHGERLHATRSETHQGALDAAPGQHHAEAEDEPAQESRTPGQQGREIDRRVDPHEPRRVQGLRPGEGHRDGQQPSAKATPVPNDENIGHGAHGAEIRAQRRGPEDEADDEPGQEGGNLTGHGTHRA
jgi:hypothetical protein